MSPATVLEISFILTCLIGGSLLATYDKNCENKGNNKTYFPDDCDKYIQCKDNKEESIGSCGWFHRFDEDSNECKIHFYLFGYVNCSLTNENTTPKPTNSPPTTAPSNSTTPKPNAAIRAEQHLFLNLILALVLTVQFFTHM